MVRSSAMAEGDIVTDAVVCVVQLVELKNGETFNGHLVACDNFMNLTLKEAYETSAVCAHSA